MGLPSGLFPSGLPTKMLHATFISSIHTKCPALLILLGLLNRIILGGEVQIRRYPYFDVVVWVVWSNHPDSYAGGSAATGNASRVRQVKGDHSDKKGHPGPADWGLRVGLKTPTRKKTCSVEKLLQLET